jgi:hypothetical protein
VLAALLAAGAALLLSSQCSAPASVAPPQLTIAYVGNFRGFQRTCGCNTEQYGGLLRLGALMQQADALFAGKPLPALPAPPAAKGAPPDGQSTAAEPGPVTDMSSFMPTEGAPGALASAPRKAVVEPPAGVVLPQPLCLIDCGNFAWSDLPFPALRVQTHLKALAYSGAKAAVLGSSELHLTSSQAEECMSKSPVPLTSCNVKVLQGSISIVPYVELAPQWYLVGVSSWQPAADEVPASAWFRLDDPAASAKQVISKLPPDAHVVLVAMNQPAAVMRQLAALPVTAIIGYHAESDPTWPKELAPTLPPPPGKASQVKFLSIDTTAEKPLLTPWQISTGGEWPDDPQVLEMLRYERDEQHRLLSEARGPGSKNNWRDIEWGTSDKYLPPKEDKTAGAAAGKMEYAGAKTCLPCHKDAYRVWLATKHQTAFQTLQLKGEQGSLDCLKCHTVGLLEPTGFDPLDPRDKVAGVGCENCHGPGSRHNALMEAAKAAGKLPKHPAEKQDAAKVLQELAIQQGSTDNCVKCHDPYNSPKFEKSWWDKIKHGTK